MTTSQPTTRRIVSLWLPHWPTDLLQRRARRSGDVPPEALVTAHRIGSRRLIAACCPRAAALGLHPGLPVAEAQARFPGLAIAEATPQADHQALRALARWCLNLTPHVALTLAEDGTADGLWLDVSGCAPLYAPSQALAERRLLATLRARLGRSGIAARVAVADTPGAAHALARYGGLDQTDLAPLPVAALRLDPDTCARLDTLGLARIGDLLAIPRAPLERRFGRHRLPGAGTVLHRLDQLRGRAPEPLDWLPPPGVIAARRHVFDPLVTPAGLSIAIESLAAEIATRLRAAGQGALALELAVQRCDNTGQTQRLGLAAPSADPRHLARLFTARLDELDPGEGVETIGLTVRRRARLDTHQHALAEIDGTEAPLAELVDTLANHPGLRALWRPEPVQSDVPERAWRRHDAAMPPPGAPNPPCPRPIRLIEPPCPVRALAELPDAAPAFFVWHGRRHRIRRADGPERIAGEWWQRDGERRAVRDYFRVEDEAGHRFWLFRRGDGQQPETGDLRWFLHGIF